MPRSHQSLPYAAVVPPRVARLLVTLTAAACGIAACQPTGRAGANGVETGTARIDSAGRDSGFKTDTAKPPPPGTLRVSNVMIGRGIGSENRISEPTLRFAPADTVFISIATEGTPDSATLAARWTFPTGKVQDSASTTIRPKGAGHSELHAAPPKDGWPVGSYLVTVYNGSDSVDAKTFAVQK